MLDLRKSHCAAFRCVHSQIYTGLSVTVEYVFHANSELSPGGLSMLKVCLQLNAQDYSSHRCIERYGLKYNARNDMRLVGPLQASPMLVTGP